MSQFQIEKTNFASSRIVSKESAKNTTLNKGEVLVKIQQFAYSANNITYAAVGDKMGYWHFFPPTGKNTGGWGVTPVWGFAEVTVSKTKGIPVGDRLFGYFPPASHLVMTPVGINQQRLTDGTAHRSKLPAGYNIYRRVNNEKGYNKTMDKFRMLLFPLHLTSFCLWDLSKTKEWYRAKQILVLSASSKTSTGLGFALKSDASAPPVIGITSANNLAAVEKMKLYDGVITYQDIANIKAIPTLIIDMSGNLEVLTSLERHLGSSLNYCIRVGLTHWENTGEVTGKLAKKSEFFFAPDHIQQRIKDWGPEGFERKTNGFLKNSAKRTANWLTFRELDGLEGLQQVHPDVCAGKVSPTEGLIVNM
ncbi:MAG: hypothetical protein ACJA0J_000988 [Bdellovibrionota bacterium]|jgi:hypothetical protein